MLRARETQVRSEPLRVPGAPAGPRIGVYPGREKQLRGPLVGIAALTVLVTGWWLGSWVSTPAVLPSPYSVGEAFAYLISEGLLLNSISASVMRISGGWMLGLLVGVPLGLTLGLSRPVRLVVQPYITGLRYIPPIALVTVFLIWFGTGEISKILLLFYTAVFIVTINTMAGVTCADEGLTRAAKSLGASPQQVVSKIILPQAVPYIVVGARLALANTFITIVAVEMVAAQSGIGYLIWSSRHFMLTDQVVAGIITAGIIGIVMDRVMTMLCKPLHDRYGRT